MEIAQCCHLPRHSGQYQSAFLFFRLIAHSDGVFRRQKSAGHGKTSLELSGERERVLDKAHLGAASPLRDCLCLAAGHWFSYLKVIFERCLGVWAPEWPGAARRAAPGTVTDDPPPEGVWRREIRVSGEWDGPRGAPAAWHSGGSSPTSSCLGLLGFGEAPLPTHAQPHCQSNTKHYTNNHLYPTGGRQHYLTTAKHHSHRGTQCQGPTPPHRVATLLVYTATTVQAYSCYWQQVNAIIERGNGNNCCLYVCLCPLGWGWRGVFTSLFRLFERWTTLTRNCSERLSIIGKSWMSLWVKEQD